jgi:hypothetical protein
LIHLKHLSARTQGLASGKTQIASGVFHALQQIVSVMFQKRPLCKQQMTAGSGSGARALIARVRSGVAG